MADEEKLREQKRQIEAKLKRIEALKKTKKRKEDTRRKIIAGGALLALAERDPQARKNIFKYLDDSITNQKDRALIGLDVPQEQPPSVAETVAEKPIKSSSSEFEIKPDTPL